VDTKWYPITEHVKLDPFQIGGGPLPVISNEKMKWETNELMDASAPISKHSQVLYQTENDNLLLLVGGKTSSTEYSQNIISVDLESYEISEIKTKNPLKLTGHVSFYYLDSVYVFGGVDDKYELNNSIFQFNFESKEWKELACNGIPPSKRYDTSICMISPYKLCLFGGRDNEQYFNDLFIFDIRKLKWKSIVASESEGTPTNRYGSSMVFNSKLDCLFLFGGMDKEDEYLNDVHQFNFKNNEWTLTEDDGELPEKRIGQSITRFGDLVFISNGFNGECFLHDLFEFNMETLIWTEITQSGIETLSERAGNSLIYYDGTLIMYGGDNKKSTLKDVHILRLDQEIIEKYEDYEEYTKETEEENTGSDWKAISINGQTVSRTRHSSVIVDKKLITFGGLYDKNGTMVPNQDMYSFDFDTFEWTKMKQNKARQQPDARTDHTCIPYKNELIFFCGSAKQTYAKSTVHVFELESNSWSTPKCVGSISARTMQASCLFDTNKIAVFGGYNSKHFNDLNIYNIETFTWTAVTPKSETIPSGRANPTMVSYVNSSNETILCLFGGEEQDNKTSNDLYEFNLTKGEWNLIKTSGDFISGRFGHSTVSNGKDMYVFGGNDGKNFLDHLFVYNFESKTWTKIDKTLNQPKSRMGSTLNFHNNSLVLFGGENESTPLMETIQTFELQK
jgi:N-acetylneuraminic acid mutarotase